jgi:hypothetical protein
MQTEQKHEALDQFSQARGDPEESKQYSDSIPLISFKSHHIMSPLDASAMLEPEKRNLLLTGKNSTLWVFWMRGRLLKKGREVICSEDEKDSRLTPEKEAEGLDLLLTLDEIESKMVIEARDIDLESKVKPDSKHLNILRALNLEESIIHLKGASSNILTRDKRKTVKFPKKKCCKKDTDKSEGGDTTVHQVYSVMARARPEEWILDSAASAHTTGIKSLLKDYKEVATTTMTVANGDILPAKGVGDIPFKTEHGYVTVTGPFTYQNWIETSFRFLNLPQRVLQYEC